MKALKLFLLTFVLIFSSQKVYSGTRTNIVSLLAGMWAVNQNLIDKFISQTAYNFCLQDYAKYQSQKINNVTIDETGSLSNEEMSDKEIVLNIEKNCNSLLVAFVLNRILQGIVATGATYFILNYLNR